MRAIFITAISIGLHVAPAISNAQGTAPQKPDYPKAEPEQKHKPNSVVTPQVLPPATTQVSLQPLQPTSPSEVPLSSAPGFWAKYGKDVLFSLGGVLLGSLVAFYATIVFERYKRFRGALLDIAKERQLNEPYPTSVKNLQPVYEKAIRYWSFLERKQWTLNADGHYKAAAEVGRLVSFAFRSGICIESMLNKDTKGLPADQYLSFYQSEFNRIKNKNFVQFEQRLRPSWKAILQPYPHPYAPVAAESIPVDYFKDIL